MDLFKTHPRRSVKNVDIIFKNVHAINVHLTLLIGFCYNLNSGSKKREEKQNIGKDLETKVITLLNDALVYIVKVWIKNTLLRTS